MVLLGEADMMAQGESSTPAALNGRVGALHPLQGMATLAMLGRSESTESAHISHLLTSDVAKWRRRCQHITKKARILHHKRKVSLSRWNLFLLIGEIFHHRRRTVEYVEVGLLTAPYKSTINTPRVILELQNQSHGWLMLKKNARYGSTWGSASVG